MIGSSTGAKNPQFLLGLDIGSTTVKLIAIPFPTTSSSPQQQQQQQRLKPTECVPVFKRYLRHRSDIKEAVSTLLTEAEPFLHGQVVTVGVTGSGGIHVASALQVPFFQEVISCTEAVETLIPQTDVSIELGGEDAKITFFGQQLEQRMNSICAGGTGSFIEHMGTLLKTDAAGLDVLASKHQQIYPIASRCGVFAKSDIQPLLNEGAKKEDIAASIFQAVVNQTIAGLACGKPIRGRVAFLGGPLHFLPNLRQRFIETLHLSTEESIVPPDANLFVAIGTALLAMNTQPIVWEELFVRIPEVMKIPREERRLPPMFANESDYLAFVERHSKHKVKRGDFSTTKGNLFIGMDSGSTTTKLAVIDDEGKLLYSFYGPNLGDPMGSTAQALLTMFSQINPEAKIARSVVTGYGEGLIKAGLHVDEGVIETLAHFKAANFFLPGVTFLIDIGGQDMKSLHITNGVIDSIMLNEACSSGCGSFISTFAESLGMTIQEFAFAGVSSQSPVDLGSRCTVFMSSKVKQAQKEGAKVNDISGGIAISVIKNALWKVIRLNSADDMGDKVVVQGGTFQNDAVLRAFELVSGRQAIRPDIAGLMGAFGAALIARETYHQQSSSSSPTTFSTLLTPQQIRSFSSKSRIQRCGKCPNNCLLTVNEFSDGSQFVSGNRCERGSTFDNKQKQSASNFKEKQEPLPNIYTWKAKRVFRYAPLSPDKAKRGDIGIPRALNMYDDYPFWMTLFSRLGFRVLLSAQTTKSTFELGMETIPSDTVCFPAKLLHGHVEELARRVHIVWMPCISFNRKEDAMQQNQYNCPVVASYPDVCRVNCNLHQGSVQLLTPFMPLEPTKDLAQRLLEELGSRHLGEDKGAPPLNLNEIVMAVNEANLVMEQFRAEVRAEGEKALQTMKDRGLHGVVLLGRPYHCDPEVNHGIPEALSSYGIVVLSEDSIAHLGREMIRKELRVVNQWTYHNRLYAASSYAATRNDLDVLQLISFGCGLDAVTSDQCKEIIEGAGRLYTSIKIDEISNLGAARIRIRSMLAAINERAKIIKQPNQISIQNKNEPSTSTSTSVVIPIESNDKNDDNENWPVFPANAQQNGWTLLAPNFSEFHMECLTAVPKSEGFNTVRLTEITRACIDEGVKYVNSDACFPAICVIGQLILALKTGNYNLDKTAVLITQTGGACRATNYIAFLKKALRSAGFNKIPVISANMFGLNPQPGWKMTNELLLRALIATFYGDLFMSLVYRTRPYELEPGSSMALYQRFEQQASQNIISGGRYEFSRIVRDAIQAFDQLPLTPEGDGFGNGRKPRIGIVGEILVKLNADANNHVAEYLENHEDAEVMTHGLADFLLYCTVDDIARYQFLGGSWSKMIYAKIMVSFMESLRFVVCDALKRSRRFHPPPPIIPLSQLTSRYLSICHQSGEGWFLVGEILSMLAEGTSNVLCVQPFGCLPNHITGRGMIRLLRTEFPELNIAAVDYDPGASQINQLNRIKLLLTVAKRRNNNKQQVNSVISPPPPPPLSPATNLNTISPNMSFTPGPSDIIASTSSTKQQQKNKQNNQNRPCQTFLATAKDIEDAVEISSAAMDPISRSKLCQSCSISVCSTRVAEADKILSTSSSSDFTSTSNCSSSTVCTATLLPPEVPKPTTAAARQVLLAHTIETEQHWWITRFLLLLIVDIIFALGAIRKVFNSAAHEVSTAAGDAASEATALLGRARNRGRNRFGLSVTQSIAVSVMLCISVICVFALFSF